MSEPQTHVVPAAVADLPEGNYVYILQCNDQTLYTGWTTSLQHRLETHNSGSGANIPAAAGRLRLFITKSFPENQTR